jgi:DNA polymerase III subunit alpha
VKFSHLHTHTQYSLLDGAASISSLYKKAMKDGMPALAITDHGNMFGAFDFVSEAHKHKNEDGTLKVKPIVGCEFYVVADRTRRVFTKEQKDERFHQVLLAKNKAGYQNLIKLTSMGYMEGLYGKYPRIDKPLIEKHSEGLIATTCCLGAYVPQTILRQGEEAAEIEFRWWLDRFGEDYYVELQRHGIEEQVKVNEILLGFATKYGVKVIASNDSHYTDKEDYDAHDILLCINTGEKKSTPGYDDFVNDDVQLRNRRFKFPNDQFYFKDTKEMTDLFSDRPDAIDNTNEIVDKVDVLNLKKDILLPNFPVPLEFQVHADSTLNQWEYLRHLSYEGVRRRYNDVTPEIQERLDFELFTIKTMGFAGYFLIVSDFIKAGREIGVFIGPGRGSAAGSVVAYCIGITNIDPIKYNLLFERFLNPDRKSMPDIDTDFDDEGRQKVIDYVVQKYGRNQVAQIVTYGTMAAKMSIKDVARVMDLPLAEANALAKLVPDRPGIELRRVLHAPMTPKDGEKSLTEKDGLIPDDLENVKKIRQIYNGTDLHAKVLHEAERLEGSVRNTGLHAAGIIIAPEDLMNIIPVCMTKESELLVTQIEGSIIEEAGVIKMDFLGLKTLTILRDALRLIRENHDIDIDLDTLPLDDPDTYAIYQKAETIGTFQFESPGMQKYLRELKPDRFDDLIAMNALYRPGPLEYIPNFIARKHGTETIAYDLPEMEEYLKETYGITVYQEQVMLLSQKLAGFTKGDADVLRKAMGKKQKAILDKMKSQFIKGASAKGHPAAALEKIWTDWEAFAQYAFNKSHSTCYAMVAYQTAYLKAHYPSEYMAAVLNNAGAIEKITFFMEECKRMGLKVLGPDINESKAGFAVNRKGEVRFGLGGLKGVGEAAIDALLAERTKSGPYTDIWDLIKRSNQRTVNKKSLECLVKSGAFDCFTQYHRGQYFFVAPGEQVNGLEKIIRFGNQYQTNLNTQVNSLFGDLAMPAVQSPKLPDCEPWTLTTLLDHEKDVTGIFLSGHPLDHFKFEIQHYGITSIAGFNEFKEGISLQANPFRPFRLAGLVADAQHRISKTGKQFGIFGVEDYSGKMEVPLFGEDYIKFKDYFTPGTVIYINGSFKNRFNREDDFEFKVTGIMLLETIKRIMTRQLLLEIHPLLLTEEIVGFLENQVGKYPGKTALRIQLKDEKSQRRIGLQRIGTGFEMNDEMAHFLLGHPDVEVNVVTTG